MDKRKTHSYGTYSEIDLDADPAAPFPLAPSVSSSLSTQKGFRDEAFATAFVRILDMPTSPPAAAFRRSSLLAQLCSNFVATATQYVRVIVPEMMMPPSAPRSVPVRAVGGVHGGIKLATRDILFKVAADNQREDGSWLFGGTERPDPAAAAKAAGAELRASSALFHAAAACEPPLRVPFMVRLDYLGTRVLAMPVLPLGAEAGGRMVMGSSDGGATYASEDAAFSAAARALAAEMHLAPHVVAGREAPLAGDVEGHTDAHGNRWLLDLARAFPPEAPEAAQHLAPMASPLFSRFLRPEFVRGAWKRHHGAAPLSPDALTSFGRGDPAAAEHGANATEAAKYLLHGRVVPQLCADLCAAAARQLRGVGGDAAAASTPSPARRRPRPMPVARRRAGGSGGGGGAAGTISSPEEIRQAFAAAAGAVKQVRTMRTAAEEEVALETSLARVGAAFHRRGVPLRHMGLVRRRVLAHPDADTKCGPQEVRELVGSALLAEMLARAAKSMLRSVMRREVERSMAAGAENPDYQVRSAVAGLLNLLTGAVPEERQRRFFEAELPNAVRRQYGWQALDDEEGPARVDPAGLCDFLAVDGHLLALVAYVLGAAGARAEPAAWKAFETGPQPGFEFCTEDVLELRVVARPSALLDEAAGEHLAARFAASAGKPAAVRARLADMAAARFDAAMASGADWARIRPRRNNMRRSAEEARRCGAAVGK